MKKTMLFLMALVLLGCKKENPKVESEGLGDAINNVSSLSKIAHSADDVSKKVDELSKINPITNEQIKAAFPESFLNLKRVEYQAGAAGIVNVTMAEAKYQSETSDMQAEIKITDGAGVGSSIVAGIMFTLASELEKETPTGYEKVMEINGTKALVKQEKQEGKVESQIAFLYQNRYLVDLEGDCTVDELTKSMASLNLKVLP